MAHPPSFSVRYEDRSYLVRLYESLGVGAELHGDEWLILTGSTMIAALPYRDLETREDLEKRVLNVLSSRVR
jgi:hypothetical protein